MSTGLVHDYLLVCRGAERTFAHMAAVWPDAPIYTLLYDPCATARLLPGRSVQGSDLQRLGVTQNGFRALLPVLPMAAERLPIGGHDLIVSSSSAFAHGVRCSDESIHICYCHSPFRYVWHERRRALVDLPRPTRPLANALFTRLRRWDVDAAQRVSAYIANSEVTRRRIQEFWGRDADVVHPPVDVSRFSITQPEDYFLVVTELMPHKRVELALSAARKAGCRIKVVGGGPSLKALRERFSDAEFLGRVDDQRVADLLGHARALVVPSVEEFGIAAVEAQAAGRPVLAPAAGGTTETVVDGFTGVLVPPGDVDALAEAMSHVQFDRFDPARVRAHALRFGPEMFQQRLVAAVRRNLTSLGAPVPAWAR
jgi:glycosyltransferase involved in cell wall biosynthesis